ncbi:Zinc finger MYM-type protein 1 [Anabarilius grahami]|uniref:Zinc finger MYM-type protein 1 n=1 Tax=Anabarilius grahami TaxID=495550 RepID=A0A3N0YHA3_ANAGA|nr:Zinc finger MYM-type protein 1 [Anabarilius grahami]
MKKTAEHLQRQRGEFDRIFALVEEHLDTSKRNRGADKKEQYKDLFFKILDTIDLHMEKRISSVEKLAFLSLLDFSKFVEYDKTFPDTAFNSLKETYAHFFDYVLLRSELKVLYASPELVKRNVSELTLFMRSTGLCNGMTQLYKLCELFLTVPSTTASVERTFSALKRIKTFQRNATGQRRLSGLALMSIEKRMLHLLKTSDSFYEKVIDEFTKKDRRMNFIYK